MSISAAVLDALESELTDQADAAPLTLERGVMAMKVALDNVILALAQGNDARAATDLLRTATAVGVRTLETQAGAPNLRRKLPGANRWNITRVELDTRDGVTAGVEPAYTCVFHTTDRFPVSRRMDSPYLAAVADILGRTVVKCVPRPVRATVVTRAEAEALLDRLLPPLPPTQPAPPLHVIL